MHTAKRHNIAAFILSAILLLTIVQNCSNPVEPPKLKEKILDTLYSKAHFLWPSKVGNYWDFKTYDFRNYYNRDSNWIYEGFASFGLDLDTIQSELSLYRLEIVDSIFTDIDDTVYSCHVFDGYDPTTQKYRNLKSPYWIGDDGIYNMGIYVEGKDALFKKGLYIPTEIPLNVDWKGQFSYKQYGYFHTTTVVERMCLSKNEVITTPMGAFECYVIRTRIWQAEDVHAYYDFYDYFAPGVGLVCTIRMSVSPGLMDEIIQWGLDYISIINNYSIKLKK